MKCKRNGKEHEFAVWDGTNNSEVEKLDGEIRIVDYDDLCKTRYHLYTKYGEILPVHIGDHIIQGVGSGLVALPQAIFERLYERVSE
jgi:hypothetical protein